MTPWRSNLSTAELVYRAHLQLKHWRTVGDVDRTAFWYLRRDELLEQLFDESPGSLAESDPALDRRLTISGPVVRILKAGTTGG